MKLIKTVDAEGQVICHDMTRIVPGEFKGAQFKKGHIITKEDIPVLLSMGKENIYIWELKEGMLHENDAGKRLADLCIGENMYEGTVSEGKIEIFTKIKGLFRVDADRLNMINSIDDLMIATRPSFYVVEPGDKLCGTRVIPLVIDEKTVEKAEKIADGRPLLEVLPFRLRTAGVVNTGSEVSHGRIEDAFTPALVKKLKALDIEMTEHIQVDDDTENIKNAILEMRSRNVDMILCTGGMSVDPDDNTPGAIKLSGARIVTYGAPVLPGAMFLLGYFEDGTPVMGLPGCVMYAKSTIFDLALSRIAAGIKMEKKDFAAMGVGGLCLGCGECHYPNCSFGK